MHCSSREYDARRPDSYLYPAFDDDTTAAGMLRATLRLAHADMAAGHTNALYHVVDRDAAVGRLLMHVLERDGFQRMCSPTGGPRDVWCRC